MITIVLLLNCARVCDAQVISLSRDTVSVFDSGKQKTMIIFINNACQSCVSELSTWMNIKRIDTSSCRIICLVTVAPNSMARRQSVANLHSLFPTAEILFEITSSYDDYVYGKAVGLTKQFNVTTTPSVAIWNNKDRRVELLATYMALFDATGALYEHETALIAESLQSQ